MKLRHRYLIAGVAWALVLGPVATYSVLGAALGATWIWLYGDNPWPSETGWIIPAIGISAGAITSTCCIFFAYRHGQETEARRGQNSKLERRKTLWVTITPLGMILGLCLVLFQGKLDRESAAEIHAQRNAFFAGLLDTRHRPTQIEIIRGDEGQFRAGVQIIGRRVGPYKLIWQVQSSSYDRVLLAGEQILNLSAGRDEVAVAFSLDELAQSYRDMHLTGGGVIVDEPFEIRVKLAPQFSEKDLAMLPEAERSLLARGDSQFLVRNAAPFTVRFRIGPDGAIHY